MIQLIYMYSTQSSIKVRFEPIMIHSDTPAQLKGFNFEERGGVGGGVGGGGEAIFLSAVGYTPVGLLCFSVTCDLH